MDADKNSPQYKTIIDCFPMLVDCLNSSVESLGDELFSEGLIPPAIADKTRTDNVSKANRVRDVLQHLRDNIKHFPIVYSMFLEILIKQGPYTKLIVKELTSCYEAYQATQDQPKCGAEIRAEGHGLELLYWDTCSGKYAYSASGKTEVLFIVPGLSGLAHGAVPRRTQAELSGDEQKKLEDQGVPRDCHHNDLEIMTKRIYLDQDKSISEVVRGSYQKATVMEKITQLMSNTSTSGTVGVMLYYIGPGKKGTGDWCFDDGCITFREIMDLYMRNEKFKRKILYIVSDCSYSGCWVREAMVFMNNQGVGPCGHEAKEKGILVKVFSSCQPNEVPTELAFSTQCAQNDKNTGDISYKISLHSTKIQDGQQPSGIDFTEIQCDTKIDQPCTMAPGSVWNLWPITSSKNCRVFLVRGKNKGRPVWLYILLIDNKDNIQNFKEKVRQGNVIAKDHGQIIKSGLGKDPPEEVKREMQQYTSSL